MKGVFILLSLVCVSLGHIESPLSRFSKNTIREGYRDNVVLTASPTLLQANGWVNVTFSVSDPSEDDIIAVYSPANVNVTLTAPVKFKYANSSKHYIKTGKGEVDFFLINRRADYSFVLLRGWISDDDGDNYTALGISNSVEFSNYQVPTSPRLSLTANQNEMILTWSSLNYNNPIVKVGTQSGIYTSSYPANSNTFTQEQMCGGNAAGYGWRDPGLIHSALISNLNPSTTYYYIFGDENAGGFSQEYSFTSAPTVGASSKIRLAAYGREIST